MWTTFICSFLYVWTLIQLDTPDEKNSPDRSGSAQSGSPTPTVGVDAPAAAPAQTLDGLTAAWLPPPYLPSDALHHILSVASTPKAAIQLGTF